MSPILRILDITRSYLGQPDRIEFGGHASQTGQRSPARLDAVQDEGLSLDAAFSSKAFLTLVDDEQDDHCWH